MDPATTPVGPLSTPMPCPKCGRPWPAEVVEFSNGAKHIHVRCRVHVGGYAPWDDDARAGHGARNRDASVRSLDFFGS